MLCWEGLLSGQNIKPIVCCCLGVNGVNISAMYNCVFHELNFKRLNIFYFDTLMYEENRGFVICDTINGNKSHVEDFQL